MATALLAVATELFKRNRAMDEQSAEVAALFCEMSSAGQAEFFEHVARIMNSWNGPAALLMQCQYIANAMNDDDEDAGRQWVRELACRIEAGGRKGNED